MAVPVVHKMFKAIIYEFSNELEHTGSQEKIPTVYYINTSKEISYTTLIDCNVFRIFLTIPTELMMKRMAANHSCTIVKNSLLAPLILKVLVLTFALILCSFLCFRVWFNFVRIFILKIMKLDVFLIVWLYC